jgi:hypothetical protein
LATAKSTSNLFTTPATQEQDKGKKEEEKKEESKKASEPSSATSSIFGNKPIGASTTSPFAGFNPSTAASTST